jgi:uncharacterized cupin superfamily protein
MKPVVRLSDVALRSHPPYLDPGLKGDLGHIFQSQDGRFKAVYWVAEGPGKLLEQPKADELICVLEGEAIVEQGDERSTAGPGDVILWLQEYPPLITVSRRLVAFAVVYDRATGA